MKKQTIVKIVFLCALLIAIFVAALVSYHLETSSFEEAEKYTENHGDFIHFSIEDSFIEGSAELSLVKDSSLPKNAKIYYTLNGDTPNDSSTLYETPISLTKENGLTVYVVRAVVKMNDEYSDVFTKSYFLCDDPENFKGLNLISLSTDNDGLYSDENGILVYGNTYNNYVNEGNDVDELPAWQVPANFKSYRGYEYERLTNVEFYADSSLYINQMAGLTLTGGASSYQDKKSLKLCARTDYDLISKFDFSIFDDFYENQNISNTFIPKKTNKLVLRNGGQDYSVNLSYARQYLVNKVAQNIGFFDAPPIHYAAVFLNGEFYNIVQLMPQNSNYFISKVYNLADNEALETIGDSEDKLWSKAGIISPLNTEQGVEQLESAFDTDLLIKYYALEMYAGNSDWIGNNVKFWRYVGDKDFNQYTDGLLRPLIYDFDISFNEERDVFEAVFEGYDDTKFPELLENDKYRYKFVNDCIDLANSQFTLDNATRILNDAESEILRYTDNSELNTSSIFKTESIKYGIESIKNFIGKRNTDVYSMLEDKLGCCDKYVLNITGCESSGVSIKLNDIVRIDSGDAYSATYFGNIPVTVSCNMNPGLTFKCWVVNGVEISDPVINLSSADVVDGNVNVTVKVSAVEGNSLKISEVNVSGGTDWVEITNYGKDSVYLGDYFLSDREAYLCKNPLPDMWLEGGEAFLIHCKNNLVFGEYSLSFNISEGETIFISDIYGNVYDELVVTKTPKDISYGINSETGEYVYFYNATPGEYNK